jgi:mannosylglucosylglycerate synthase
MTHEIKNMKIVLLVPPIMPFYGISGNEGVHTIIQSLYDSLKIHNHPIKLLLPSNEELSSSQYSTLSYKPFPPFTQFVEDRNKFAKLVSELYVSIAPVLKEADCCIVYDTLFDLDMLPLTKAISNITKSTQTPIIFYNFECSEKPKPPLANWSSLDTPPWDVIPEICRTSTLAFPTRSTWKKIKTITSLEIDKWYLLPPSLDISKQFNLNEDILGLWEKNQLWNDDLVLLLPALNRANNNIEKALRVIKCLKKKQIKVHLLLTICKSNWLEVNEPYFDRICLLAERLGISQNVIFLSEVFPSWSQGLSRQAINSLYFLSDAVILPTNWEGFGLVSVEASMMRIPIFCTNLPVLNEVTDDTAYFFDPNDDECNIAATILHVLNKKYARARRAGQRYYLTRHLYEKFICPLLSRACKHSQDYISTKF